MPTYNDKDHPDHGVHENHDDNHRMRDHERARDHRSMTDRNESRNDSPSPIGGPQHYGMNKEDFNSSIGKNRPHHEERNDENKPSRQDQVKTQQKAAPEVAAKRSRLAQRRAIEEKEEEAQRKADEDSYAPGIDLAADMHRYDLRHGYGPRERGILAKMRAYMDPRDDSIARFDEKQRQAALKNYRELTPLEKNLGLTERDIYEGAGLGNDVSEKGIADLVSRAANEKEVETVGDFASAPLPLVGQAIVGGLTKVGEWVVGLWNGETDWQKAIKDNLKNDMQASSHISDYGQAAQLGTGILAAKGVKAAQKIAPVVFNPVFGGFLSAADNMKGMADFKTRNADYLKRYGIMQNTPHENIAYDRGGNHHSSEPGILPNMLPPAPPKALTTPPQKLPKFSWVDSDDFSFDYTMG